MLFFDSSNLNSGMDFSVHETAQAQHTTSDKACLLPGCVFQKQSDEDASTVKYILSISDKSY
jgi:hypothetical protein